MIIYRNHRGDVVIDWGEGNNPRYAQYGFVGFKSEPPPEHVTVRPDGALEHYVSDDFWAPVYSSPPEQHLTDKQRELLTRLANMLANA